MIATDKLENGSRWRPAVASLVSGTQKNWVSSHVLKRFEKPEMLTLSPPEKYSAFQGAEFTGTRAIWLTWHSDKSRKSHETLFRIVDDGPFDVVIGSDLLFKEGIFAVREAVLSTFPR